MLKVINLEMFWSAAGWKIVGYVCENQVKLKAFFHHAIQQTDTTGAECPLHESTNCILWFWWNWITSYGHCFFQFSFLLSSAPSELLPEALSEHNWCREPNTNFETRCWQFDNSESRSEVVYRIFSCCQLSDGYHLLIWSCIWCKRS